MESWVSFNYAQEINSKVKSNFDTPVLFIAAKKKQTNKQTKKKRCCGRVVIWSSYFLGNRKFSKRNPCAVVTQFQCE